MNISKEYQWFLAEVEELQQEIPGTIEWYMELYDCISFVVREVEVSPEESTIIIETLTKIALDAEEGLNIEAFDKFAAKKFAQYGTVYNYVDFVGVWTFLLF